MCRWFFFWFFFFRIKIIIEDIEYFEDCDLEIVIKLNIFNNREFKGRIFDIMVFELFLMGRDIVFVDLGKDNVFVFKIMFLVFEIFSV